MRRKAEAESLLPLDAEQWDNPRVRVSNELGRGNYRAARFAIKVNLGTSISIGLFFWILCLVLGQRVAYLFTSDKHVIGEVSNLVVLLAFTVLLNSVQPVLSGVAIGSGRQGMVAWLNVVSYYIVGVPVGVGFAYIAGFGVKGIWIGMLIGSTMQTIWLGTVIWRTNWEEQVEKASERMNTWLIRKPEEMANGSMTQPLGGSNEEQKPVPLLIDSASKSSARQQSI
ncbi:hypothetical protein MLD38_030969 [Melastoma candidum]|uniref:Uncharacterized protein n=1 Tax=Melastoma candidum TaxID=119954 RepID=A0ACB9MQD9_9MYRT|nr:hypothetical protein MLD38_030969 [Melastoma candidum]